MKKSFLFLLCLLFLMGTRHTMQAALVEVTLNSVTKTMTLYDKNNEPLTEDSHTGNTYVFTDVPKGEYTLYGYNSDSELNGTFKFNVGDADMSLQIWTIPN